MRRKRQRGVAILEFSLIMLVQVPLLLGTTAVGLNMLRTLETVQLARDAGHMYAKGTDFSQPGNQTVLLTLGSDLGLTGSSTTSQALVILSSVTYVDQAMCASAGKVDAQGNPLGCTNLGNWVFTQRIEIGQTALRTSNFGSPLTSGPNGLRWTRPRGRSRFPTRSRNRATWPTSPVSTRTPMSTARSAGCRPGR